MVRRRGAISFAFADRTVVERAYLGWLGPTLVQARDALPSRSASQLGTA